MLGADSLIFAHCCCSILCEIVSMWRSCSWWAFVFKKAPKILVQQAQIAVEQGISCRLLKNNRSESMIENVSLIVTVSWLIYLA